MHIRATVFYLLALGCAGAAPRAAETGGQGTDQTVSVAVEETEVPALVEVSLGLEEAGWEPSGADQFAEERAQWDRCLAGDSTDCSIQPRILGFCPDAYVSLEIEEIASCGDDPVTYLVRRTTGSGTVTEAGAPLGSIFESIQGNMQDCETATDVRHTTVTRAVGIRGATSAMELAGELEGLFLTIQSEGNENIVYLARPDDRGVALGRVACGEHCASTPSVLHVAYDAAASRIAVAWSLVNGEHCGVDQGRSAIFSVDAALLAMLR